MKRLRLRPDLKDLNEGHINSQNYILKGERFPTKFKGERIWS